MTLKLRINRQSLYNALITVLLISVWAFNETKYITYPIKILSILTFGLYTVRYKRFNSRYQAWCLAMILCSVITTISSYDRSASAYFLVNMLQVLLLGFTLYGYVDSAEKTDFILKRIVLAGIVLAVRLLIVTPLSVWLSWQRLGEAIGSNANDVGNKAAFSAILALCLAKREEKRFAYYAAFGILSAIVLFTGSRKALLALVTAIVLLNTVGLRNKRNMLFTIVGIAVVLAVAYRVIMNNDTLYATIGRRIQSMMDVFFHGATENTSITLRERYLRSAWEIIKTHPVLGVGLGNFAIVSGFGVYSHCDYTEVACSYGLIGALIYYLPLVSLTLRSIVRKQKDDMDYLFLILQAILLLTYVSMVMYTSAYTQIMVILSYAHECYAKQTSDDGLPTGSADTAEAIPNVAYR